MNYKRVRNYSLIIATVVMNIIYLIWRIFFTIPTKAGIISLVSAIILLIVEIVGMLEAAVHYYNMYDIKHPEKPEIDDESLFPHVDVFITTYNEPEELLFKTINGCKNMDYPDKKKIHIYLCDDGNRESMRKLAYEMGIGYLTRTERKGAKAGNLNNALEKSNSPLIANFDADMIPMHDFLMATVPYFLGNEKVGFVQTPQSFYNTDLFQYYLFSEGRIPNEQDYFYRDVQISKNKNNSIIYGGTNTVISRKALEDAGGYYTKAITEDFATGLIIQSKGYQCFAVGEVHASGLAPSDLMSLVKQRQRWARGCIQTGRRLNILFRKGLNFSQKVSYISSISYWYSGIKRVAYIMAPILFAVFGVIVVDCNLTEVLIFWLPMYYLSNKELRSLSRNIRTTKWTNIYETILFPSLVVPVILETFGISQNSFLVTRKDNAKVDDRVYRLKKAIPHIAFAVLSIIGIFNCIRMIFEAGSATYSVVLFWLIVNFYNILMAIFFMVGRKSFRKTERVLAEVPCKITYNNKELNCKTIDVSEGGLAVRFEFPEYIPYDEVIKIKLFTDRYLSEFSGKVVHIAKGEKEWKYAFEITDIDKDNFKQLLYITYDRVPTLPNNLDENSSIFDDIRVNILTRNKKLFLFKRKLPRVDLDKTIASKECGDVKLKSFNYEYMALEGISESILKDQITLRIKENREIIGVLEKVQDKNIYLYKIKNYKEIADDKEIRNILNDWIREYNESLSESSVVRREESFDEFNEMQFL